jgi:glutathione synthase/RimK-type ligase-like ATP-grasp enzyme
MNTVEYDVVVLTEDRYDYPEEVPGYVKNVLVEDALLVNALNKFGLRAARFSWSDPTVDWSKVKSVVFRTTWDYFDRYPEFKAWFDKLKNELVMFNDARILEWNQDKIYLKEMGNKGVRIPETIFIERGKEQSLAEIAAQLSTEEFVLKPNVSGAARHTYRLKKATCSDFEETYQSLIVEEDFMLQAFQQQIMTKGEISLVLIDGEYTHAVLKRGKEGDFRVQDDFGGSVEEYQANREEIAFAKQCFDVLEVKPNYCRVDLIWDNEDNLALSELEMIEPELWFRNCPAAALKLAQGIHKQITR